MRKSKKNISRELGLEVGSLCGKYFLKLDHLHYGYWADGVEVDISNLHIAQDAYAQLVISHIPEGVESILDVGCGTGQIAKMLVDKGYLVDCVSPSPYLKKCAADLLGAGSEIFECRYEDLQTSKRYDVVLFCESFQYIDMEQGLSNTSELLNRDGYMVICDIFRKEVEGKMVMGGGQKQTKFDELITGFPFRLIERLDITEQTAPTIDLFNDVLEKVVGPVANAGMQFFRHRHPIAHKLVNWKYKKKIEKLRNKYLQGGRTGEEFKRYKSYQLLVYKKI